MIRIQQLSNQKQYVLLIEEAQNFAPKKRPTTRRHIMGKGHFVGVRFCGISPSGMLWGVKFCGCDVMWHVTFCGCAHPWRFVGVTFCRCDVLQVWRFAVVMFCGCDVLWCDTFCGCDVLWL